MCLGLHYYPDRILSTACFLLHRQNIILLNEVYFVNAHTWKSIPVLKVSFKYNQLMSTKACTRFKKLPLHASPFMSCLKNQTTFLSVLCSPDWHPPTHSHNMVSCLPATLWWLFSLLSAVHAVESKCIFICSSLNFINFTDQWPHSTLVPCTIIL